MFKSDKVFILPCDGIAEGETERMEIPRTGYFAVKFGKHHLERALFVELTKTPASYLPKWHVRLDGFMVAPSSPDWTQAFGKIYERAEKFGGLLLGRPIGVDEYVRLVKARASDKERGIDLSDAVDLNSVEIPLF